MKKRNVVWSLLLVVIAAGLLAGCSKKQEAPAGGAAPVEVQIAWWGGELRHKKLFDMLDIYMEKNPNVKIIGQYAPFGDHFTKMATQAAAGNMPDTYQMHLTYLAEYASKGLMRPLQDLIDAKKIDVSSFTKGALSTSSYNGQVVGITFGDTATAMVFNKSLIERAGHPLPKSQMTYSEFSVYLKELQSKLPSGYYAFWLTALDAALENYTRNLGGYGYTSEDGKQLGYSKEMLADYYNFYFDLFKAGVGGSYELMLEDSGKQFADTRAGKGQVAMWFTNVNQAKIYQVSMDDEMGITRYPIADNATHKYVESVIPTTWAFYSRSNKVDATAHFINFFVNDWDVQEIYDMDTGAPGSTVIQEKLIAGLDLNNKVDVVKKIELEVMQDILNTIQSYARPANIPAVTDDQSRKLSEIYFGSMTVQQAVDAHFATVQGFIQ